MRFFRVLFSLILLSIFTDFAFASDSISRLIILSKVNYSQKMAYEEYAELQNFIDDEIPNTFLFMGDYLGQARADNKKLENVKDEDLEFLQDWPTNTKDQYIFLPGFNEWGRNKINGGNLIRETNKELYEIFPEEQLFVFENACPGPIEIALDEKTLLLVLNDNWLINDNMTPRLDEGCPYANSLEYLSEVESIINRNSHKRILLASYNPIESSGKRAGKFNFSHHIFPYSIDNPENKLPLPLFGSLNVAYRKSIGKPEDINNLKTRVYRKFLKDLIQDKSNVVLIAANEDHFDLRKIESAYQLIAGSYKGDSYSKSDTKNSIEAGFTSVEVHEKGRLEIGYITKQGLAFDESIDNPLKELPKPSINKDELKSYYSFHGDERLLKKPKKNPGLMGINYRYEWVAEIDSIPVFDWGKELGGLEVIQKGGGMQTRSLRMEAENEKQYVLRSIKKYPESVVPKAIKGTVYANIVNDQISASHPYAAVVIPQLADAAEIYHTNPSLVYLKPNEKLKEYQYDFEEGIYLYEERPAKDRSDVESFGNSYDIESTFDILRKTQRSSEYFVDQQWVLKSRLFDIWLGDWDRHDDQWRWAKFKTEDGRKMVRPIPRDRDQAFFFSDGLILGIASRKWGNPKFQGFYHHIRDVNGLCFNARYFDRTFLTEPNLEDWIQAAEKLQASLTDEVIESAVKELPPEIYAINGELIESKLKSRRMELKKYAERFHKFLSKTVDVRGTDKRNRFEVERYEDGKTKVIVYETKKSGKIKEKLYERTFDPKVTKEIRLYGFKGDDEFILNGEAKKGIKTRIIAGGGEDKVVDNSKVKGLKKKTIVYDKKKGLELEKSSETKDKSSNQSNVNDYDRYAFRYNKIMPFASVNYNPDDGLFIGGGPLITTHGFRKSPYKQRHKIIGNVAPRSANYNLYYEGSFTDVLGKMDLDLDARLSVPSFSSFFYGKGNNTIQSEDKRDQDNQYYRVRYDLERVSIGLSNRTKNQKHYFGGSTAYFRVNIDRDVNQDDDNTVPRFITFYADSGSSIDLYDDFRFVHSSLFYEFDSRRDKRIPMNGMYFNARADFFQDMDKTQFSALRLEASESVYLRLSRRIKTVLALRVGGAHLAGYHPFFIAPNIGGNNYLRGYRRNRFTGEQTVFQNSELRIRLFKILNEYLLGDFGILLYHDIGRVWTDNPTIANTSLGYSQSEINRFAIDDRWHQGYGFGLWLAPFDMAVISADYSFNEYSEQLFFLRFGFFY